VDRIVHTVCIGTAPPIIPGTFNSRDVGGHAADGGTVRRGLLVRSDAPIDVGEAGRAVLRHLGVRTAVDLREPVERRLDPPDVDGIAVRQVPILGEELDLAESSLGDIYSHLLEHRGERLTSAVRVLGEADALPAVVFCSAGKDRTGLVIALVLGALGVATDEIVADYARTEEAMKGPFRAQLRARSIAAGLDEQELAVKLGAPASLMRDVLTWLGDRHGGAAGYLREHGLGGAELDTLRRGLVDHPQAVS
jgi:protein-tyrosine phosphatase